MDESCLFCRIIAGQVPANFVYHDDHVVAIRDIDPQAPTHVLIMPREHIAYLTDIRSEHEFLVSRLIYTANEVARREGVAESGFRLSINTGREGGQVVPHIHFHLLGGRRMKGSLG